MFRFGHKNRVGIAVTDRAVSTLEITGSVSRPRVRAVGAARLEPGVVVHGRVKNECELVNAIDRSLLHATPRRIETDRAVVNIAEHMSYLFRERIQQSAGMRGHQRSVFEERVHALVPLEDAERVAAYRVLGEDVEGTDVLIVGAERMLLERWHEVFLKLGITPVFDAEPLAFLRGLAENTIAGHTAVLVIHDDVTHLIIANGQGFAYADSLSLGVEHIAGEIAAALKVPFENAFDILNTYGLTRPGEAEFQIVVGMFEKISMTLREAFSFYHMETTAAVSAIVLAGAGGTIPGAADYFHTNFSMPVSMGTVRAVEDDTRRNKSMPEAQVAFQLLPIGLALRTFDDRFDATDPLISITDTAVRDVKILRYVSWRHISMVLVLSAALFAVLYWLNARGIAHEFMR